MRFPGTEEASHDQYDDDLRCDDFPYAFYDILDRERQSHWFSRDGIMEAGFWLDGFPQFGIRDHEFRITISTALFPQEHDPRQQNRSMVALLATPIP